MAHDVNLNVGGDLLLKSRQNLLESDFYSIGMSLDYPLPAIPLMAPAPDLTPQMAIKAAPGLII